MLPREFERVFGRPVPITAAVPNGGSYTIPADPDRYLLVIWQGAPALAIYPGEDPEQTAVPIPFPPGAVPIVFTHALHGSLAGMAFTVRANPGAGTVTYVVGRMAPAGTKPRKVGAYRGKSSSDPQAGSRRRG